MSRITNIYTGERIMTEKNALRHYLAKAKKAKKRNNYEEMRNIYEDATNILDVDICYKCPQDDLGYCGLRGNRSSLTWEEIFQKYCFDGFIRDMEHMLESE